MYNNFSSKIFKTLYNCPDEFEAVIKSSLTVKYCYGQFDRIVLDRGRDSSEVAVKIHIIHVTTYNPLLGDPFHDGMITTDVLTYYTVYISS